MPIDLKDFAITGAKRRPVFKTLTITASGSTYSLDATYNTFLVDGTGATLGDLKSVQIGLSNADLNAVPSWANTIGNLIQMCNKELKAAASELAN